MPQQAWRQEAFPDRRGSEGQRCRFGKSWTTPDLLGLCSNTQPWGQLESHPHCWSAFCSRTSKGELWRDEVVQFRILRAADGQGSAPIDVIASQS